MARGQRWCPRIGLESKIRGSVSKERQGCAPQCRPLKSPGQGICPTTTTNRQPTENTRSFKHSRRSFSNRYQVASSPLLRHNDWSVLQRTASALPSKVLMIQGKYQCLNVGQEQTTHLDHSRIDTKKGKIESRHPRPAIFNLPAVSIRSIWTCVDA